MLKIEKTAQIVPKQHARKLSRKEAELLTFLEYLDLFVKSVLYFKIGLYLMKICLSTRKCYLLFLS